MIVIIKLYITIHFTYEDIFQIRPDQDLKANNILMRLVRMLHNGTRVNLECKLEPYGT